MPTDTPLTREQEAAELRAAALKTANLVASQFETESEYNRTYWLAVRDRAAQLFARKVVARELTEAEVHECFEKYLRYDGGREASMRAALAHHLTLLAVPVAEEKSAGVLPTREQVASLLRAIWENNENCWSGMADYALSLSAPPSEKSAGVTEAQVEAALDAWYDDGGDWKIPSEHTYGDRLESFLASSRKEMRAALEAARLTPASAPPEPREGVKVRVAVAVNEGGEWAAAGESDWLDAAAIEEVNERVFCPIATHNITATVPLPVPSEIPGEVVG